MKKLIIYISLIIIGIYISFGILFYNNDNKGNEVIKFSSWGSKSETDVLYSVIKKYQENNPDTKIEFLHIPQNYFQKIHLLFASGLEPDVIFINNQYIQLYIKAGLLEDLTPYFKEAENTFYKESLDCFKNEDKLYAIPRDISNLVIYYNKDILNKQNIELPKKINTIDELKVLAEKLTTKEHFGINYEEMQLFWSYYLASNGGGIISDDKKHIIVNSEKSIYALNLYSDLVNKYHFAPTKAEIGSMTTAQMFINGKLALYLGGRWMVPKYRETLNFDWDIIEFPSSKTNRVYIDASGWAIAKNSKNKDKAIELIKYLSSFETINEFSKSGLIIPARIDSAKSPYFLDGKKPLNNKIYLSMLENAKPTPVNENFSTINDILKEKIQSILDGKTNPKDAFDEKTVKKLENLL